LLAFAPPGPPAPCLPLVCTFQAAAYRHRPIAVDISVTTANGPQAARYLAQQVRSLIGQHTRADDLAGSTGAQQTHGLWGSMDNNAPLHQPACRAALWGSS